MAFKVYKPATRGITSPSDVAGIYPFDILSSVTDQGQTHDLVHRPTMLVLKTFTAKDHGEEALREAIRAARKLREDYRFITMDGLLWLSSNTLTLDMLDEAQTDQGRAAIKLAQKAAMASASGAPVLTGRMYFDALAQVKAQS